MKTNPNDPINYVDYSPHDLELRLTDTYPGLTKREYFSAMAMQGILSYNGIDEHRFRRLDIKNAVQYADTLIRELNKDEEKNQENPTKE